MRLKRRLTNNFRDKYARLHRQILLICLRGLMSITQTAFDLTNYLAGKNPKNLSSEDISGLRIQLSQLEETCIGSDKPLRENLKGQIVLVDYPQLNLSFLEMSQETEFDGKKARIPKFGVYEIDVSTMQVYDAQLYIGRNHLPKCFGGGWECSLNDTNEIPGSFFVYIIRSIFGPFDEARLGIESSGEYWRVGGIVPEKEFKTKYGKGLRGKTIKSGFYGSIPTETQEKISEAEKTNYFDGFFIIAETSPEDWTDEPASENKNTAASKNAIAVGTQGENAFYLDKFNPDLKTS